MTTHSTSSASSTAALSFQYTWPGSPGAVTAATMPFRLIPQNYAPPPNEYRQRSRAAVQGMLRVVCHHACEPWQTVLRMD